VNGLCVSIRAIKQLEKHHCKCLDVIIENNIFAAAIMCFSKRTKRSDFMKVKDFLELIKVAHFVVEGDTEPKIRTFGLDNFGQGLVESSNYPSNFPFIFKTLSIGDQVTLSKDKGYKKLEDLDTDILGKEIISITQIKLSHRFTTGGPWNQSQITFLIKE